MVDAARQPATSDAPQVTLRALLRRPALEMVGNLVVIASLAVLVLSPLVEWGRYIDWDGGFSRRAPVFALALAIWALAPGVSLLTACATARLRGRTIWPAAVVAAGCAGAAAALAYRTLSEVNGDLPIGADLNAPGIPPYGPLTVFASTVLAFGWLLKAVAWFRRQRVEWVPPGVQWPNVVISAVVVAMLGVGGVLVVRWGDHTVDHVTARPLAAVAPAPPIDRVGELWRASTSGAIRAAGGYVVTTDERGVLVRDAVTGRPHWHYWRERRADSPPALDISADGRTVITLWQGFDKKAVLAGFELTTGRLLWTSAQDDPLVGSMSEAARRLSIMGDTAIVTGNESLGSGALGVDVRTGDVRWRWSPPPGCKASELEPAAHVLVVALTCGIRDPGTVVGLSTADATTRWSWRPPSALAVMPVYSRTALAAVGDSVLVATTDHGDLTLDTETGLERYPDAVRNPAPSGFAMHTVLRGDGVTAYLGDGRSAANVSVVDRVTGTLRWSRTVPELAGHVVTHSVVSGNLAYVASLRLGDSRQVFPGLRSQTRQLTVLDLGTGAVRLSQELTLPAECGCIGPLYPPDVELSPGYGVLAVTFGGPGGQFVIVYG